MPQRSVEEECKRADIVVRARILMIDTIYGSNTLIYDHRGVKLGKHRYRLETEKLARLQMIVEKTFKSSLNVADTIYILTPVDCAPPNVSLWLPILSEQYGDLIVYGNKWIENKIITVENGNKHIKQIQQTLISNTFITDRCTRTDLTNDC
jgi:hypothetical protein